MHLGRYELISRLARGGMGEVYLARRRGPGDIEKRVVIKRIRRELSGDPRFVEMFLSEARVSMTLSHKNIVPVFDFGRAGTELFLAMEYVRGRDLARALRAAGDNRPSPTAVAHVGIEVCRALAYAHSRSDGESIVHRDVSPKNLLLSFAGEVVVADFGLAIEASGDGPGGVRGTPAYLSPEQARGEAIDGRSDLYSLGLVLREMIDGQRGHGEGPIAELIDRARRGAIAPLEAEVPEALGAVIERATRADRDERFGSARAMQLALDDYLIAGRSAGAEPPTIELADWLATLFPDPEVRGVELDGEDLDAVTFLDDGEDAVTEEAKRLGGATAASLAATVGDSLDGPETPAGPGAPRRPAAAWLLALGGAALVAGGGIWWVTGRSDSRAATAPPPDARPAPPPAIDAAPPPPVDAAPPPPVDAAPPPPVDAAPPEPGVLEVSTSRGWAAVRVIGAGKRCPETPCRFTLRPGRYTVELSNPVRGTATRKQVRIKSGQTARLVVSM